MRKGFARTVRGWLAVVLVMGAASGCAITTQQEQQIGRDYSAQLDRELPIVNEPAVERYLSALGSELASKAGRRDVTYRFRLVNSNVVNAFAVPGGYIYINRGIVARASNMSEVAGVVAHEIAHVDLRHSAEQMGRAQTANTGLTLAYILLGRSPSSAERAAINVGGGVYFASHSREAENEADAAAVSMLVASGIDPAGLPSFFRKLLDEQRGQSSAVTQWFSTHPTTEDRIANVQGLIDRQPAARLRGLQDDSDAFRRFKTAVSRLPAASERSSGN
jgi:predicted Zn-dependent protease